MNIIFIDSNTKLYAGKDLELEILSQSVLLESAKDRHRASSDRLLIARNIF